MIPAWTILVAATGLALAVAPELGQSLALRADGPLWSAATGQWVHHGWPHALGCLASFLAIGSLCEREHPRAYPWLLATLSLGVGLAVRPTLGGEIASYRGASGVVHGLVALALADRARRRETWALALLALLACKVGLETATGEVVLAGRYESFRPWPPAHLAGASLGLALSLLLPLVYCSTVSEIRRGT